MVLRWAASALVSTEKNFRRIQGYQSLPALVAKLAELDPEDEEFYDLIDLMGGWETQLASFEPEKMNSRVEKVLTGMGFSMEDLDRQVECSDEAALTAALALAPSFTDNCSDPVTGELVLDETTPDPACANGYVRVRTWTANDGCDNVSEPYTQTITVVDTTAPVAVEALGLIDS